MPIINAGIQKALQEAGLSKTSKAETGTLEQKLEDQQLGVDDLIRHLSDMVVGSGNENVKLAAIRDGMKLHGLLKNASPAPPSINIVINDSSGPKFSVNPILIPRELTNAA